MDRLERLVNLVAALLDADVPVSREQLQERIGGYSDDPDAARRNFERDKDLLRQMGLPLITEPLDAGRPDEQFGYRIPRERYELPDPGLGDDEVAALRLAASAVRLEGGGDATQRALQKLAGGALAADGGEMASLVAGDATAAVFGALAERRQIRFGYRGTERLVDPWRLSYRRGRWYLSGWDHGRGEERLYRLDRVDGAIVAHGEADAYIRPHEVDAGPPPPWRVGDDDEVEAELLVDATQARWAASAVGEEAVAARHADGSVTLRMLVTNRDAFRSFVLGFLDHAEVVGPPALREDIVGWLTHLASSS